MSNLKLAILGSTRGTSMQAIITAIHAQVLDASIELVISNKKKAAILERGQQHHLKTRFLDDQLGQLFFEQKLSCLLDRHQIELLVLIGYMRILSAGFVNQWANKIINVHPSLLPFFAGLKDLDLHQAVLSSSHQMTGCSVHYVTEEVDNGPLLIQKSCPVFADDTKELLKARVQTLEGEALVKAIALISCRSARTVLKNG
jgi:phosphoribosylglycinamide formyltransferase 1